MGHKAKFKLHSALEHTKLHNPSLVISDVTLELRQNTDRPPVSQPQGRSIYDEVSEDCKDTCWIVLRAEVCHFEHGHLWAARIWIIFEFSMQKYRTEPLLLTEAGGASIWGA